MYRCLYCQLNFDDWGIILQHGCLENGSAIGITSENVVYLEQGKICGIYNLYLLFKFFIHELVKNKY